MLACGYFPFDVVVHVTVSGSGIRLPYVVVSRDGGVVWSSCTGIHDI